MAAKYFPVLLNAGSRAISQLSALSGVCAGDIRSEESTWFDDGGVFGRVLALKGDDGERRPQRPRRGVAYSLFIDGLSSRMSTDSTH
ncbi:hypothetical protein [Chromobacterium aquaticum]|uniref:Uncharacterized protein n=1 Tax=Chromobacterium aquaticum TaxID=467180 RepID=A0ABV8ZQW4_9NEIS|nr:hypothetical protein [Chromobacterium aquaticum]MCD5361503.1 hypothetical protein [Chromobacterium aquaticum]